ncbi:MAG: hypothetical protein K6253_00655 [Candidatus Liberibacter asiaticus]|nr:hypothetical protein [Candidatus Liberibacter asiaticus]
MESRAKIQQKINELNIDEKLKSQFLQILLTDQSSEEEEEEEEEEDYIYDTSTSS